MRRKYFGWAIAAIATLGPMQAWGGDREIAEQIIERLKVNRDSGALKDFTLDMKVDQGVVLFQGNVSQPGQKELVLQAADGIDGIAKVVDHVSVDGNSPEPDAKIVKPKAAVGAADNIAAEKAGADTAAEDKVDPQFSFRQALARQGDRRGGQPTGSNGLAAPGVLPGQVLPTAAVEPAGFDSGAEATPEDQKVTSAVVSALGRAQKQGRLKGFGVEVKSQDGVIQLSGRAGSSEQRDLIVQIAEQTPGVAGVNESIAIPAANRQTGAIPQPPVLRPMTAHQPGRGGYRPQTRMAAARGRAQAQAAPYRMNRGGSQMAAKPAGYGAAAGGAAMTGRPVMGQPVPMSAGRARPAGAPRHDSPYMPNHAWPGYAAYPNYAAVTYPQQYSPSAFPYIGPFYPYPQVPLGWRKVSLEWDDGWWFLDFTDK